MSTYKMDWQGRFTEGGDVELIFDVLLQFSPHYKISV